MIKILQGDITTYSGDAIVNAAKPSLMGGGGVDGAIHCVAGPKLRSACEWYPEAPTNYHTTRITNGVVRCPVGHAVATPGYGLQVSYVIHTVGPLYEEGDPDCAKMLAMAYRSSFVYAEKLGCRTIALPAISCGVYGYPLKEAATIAMRVAREFEDKFNEICFVMFTDETVEAFYEASLLE